MRASGAHAECQAAIPTPTASCWDASRPEQRHTRVADQNRKEAHRRCVPAALQLRPLLAHADPSVRSRVCNLVGNLCRHSAFFCEVLRETHLLPVLIARCGDTDRATRKFACFAIGNAGAASRLIAAPESLVFFRAMVK